MNPSQLDLQPSNPSPPPEASSPSFPMLTMVGLGPPIEREEPLLAPTTAYVEEQATASSERTLAGFPAAPPSFVDETAVPEEAPLDEITTVVGYDEITVVKRMPGPVDAIEQDRGVEPPLEAVGTQVAADGTESRAKPHSADPCESFAKADVQPVEASELVEAKPEIKLFPPSLDSLVPPPPTFDVPRLSRGGSLASTSEAPWFVSLETRQSSRFPRTHRVLALALAGGAVALGAVALRPSTGQVLVTVGGPQDVAVTGAVVYVNGERGCAPAPCRVRVPAGSHAIGVGAPSYRRPAEKALVVGGGTEAALHFTLLAEDRPTVEAPKPPRAPVHDAPNVEPASPVVVPVRDLEREAVRPSFGHPASLAPTLADNVELDPPSADGAGVGSKLRINSSPPCNVVLDGRPLGLTPHVVGVSEGSHSVVFVHPTKGRRSVRVEALAGKTAVASVRF